MTDTFFHTSPSDPKFADRLDRYMPRIGPFFFVCTPRVRFDSQQLVTAEFARKHVLTLININEAQI